MQEAAHAETPKTRKHASLDLWPRVLSPKEAWKYIGVKRARFYQLAADGIIQIHKFGAKSIIYREDLDVLLDAVKDGTITIAPKRRKPAAPAGDGA